ncbi:hypothetical protein MBLNU457_4712t1 [Dothideomycetes sp. NU457]
MATTDGTGNSLSSQSPRPARPSQQSVTSVQTTATATSENASLPVPTRQISSTSNQLTRTSSDRPASIRSVRSGRDFAVPFQATSSDTASLRTVRSGQSRRSRQSSSRDLTIVPAKSLETKVSSTRAGRWSSLFGRPKNKFNSFAPEEKEYGLYVGDEREMIVTYSANTDIELHQRGKGGPIVGAIPMGKGQFTINDPNSIFAEWVSIRRWYPDPDRREERDLCYGFGIQPGPWLVDTPEASPPTARFPATGERFSFSTGLWTCEAVAPVVWGQHLFFFPGKKTLIWKWIPEGKRHDFVLACVGLDNEIFATFHGVQNGLIKFRQDLTEEQERAILLVLCFALDRTRKYNVRQIIWQSPEHQIKVLNRSIVIGEQREREEREEDARLASMAEEVRAYEARPSSRYNYDPPGLMLPF